MSLGSVLRSEEYSVRRTKHEASSEEGLFALENLVWTLEAPFQLHKDMVIVSWPTGPVIFDLANVVPCNWFDSEWTNSVSRYKLLARRRRQSLDWPQLRRSFGGTVLKSHISRIACSPLTGHPDWLTS